MKNAFTGNHKEFNWTPVFADGSSIKLTFPVNSAFFDRSGLLRFFNLKLGNGEIITLSLVPKNQFLHNPGMAWIKHAGVFMTETVAQQYLDKKKHEEKAIIELIKWVAEKTIINDLLHEIEDRNLVYRDWTGETWIDKPVRFNPASVMDRTWLEKVNDQIKRLL